VTGARRRVTDRELEVLLAYVDDAGGSYSEAARVLRLSESTVKSTLERVRSKTDSRCTAQAVYRLADALIGLALSRRPPSPLS
jgi:DNA-binding NarL/FixJ family response regulator